jgi:TPR repeat protein
LTEAVKWYQRAAAQGQLEAELALGDIYLGGGGRPADYRAARKWFERAAAQKSASAENSLGYVYEHGGSGVAGDVAKAVKHYRLAAAAGYGKGQLNLGRMYLDGAGVEKDLIEAYKWFYLASRNGGRLGRHYMDELAGTVTYGDFKGTPLTAEQIREAMRRAKEFQDNLAKHQTQSH